MKTLVLLLGMLGVASTGFAESPGAIKYLSAEPVSMLDWGLYRLESELEDFSFQGIDLFRDNSAHALYRHDTERIEAKVVMYPSSGSFGSNPQKSGAESLCTTAIRQLQDYFGRKESDMSSMIARLFTPRGNAGADIPESLGDDIASLVDMEVEVVSSRKNRPPFTAQATCRSTVYGDRVQFAR